MSVVLLKGNAVDLGVSRASECVKTGVVDDDSVRLILSDSSVKLVELPVGAGLDPVAVKEEASDLTVIAAEDLYAGSEVFKILIKIVSKDS